MTSQTLHDAIRGVSIPQIGPLANSRWTGKHVSDLRIQGLKLDQAITTLAHCNWSLSSIAQSETWDTQISRFLLYTAGVCQHESRRDNRTHEFDIPERRQEIQL